MTRVVLLFLSAGHLVACAEYREPKVNCFSFVSRGSGSIDCGFEPLGGDPKTGEEGDG